MSECNHDWSSCSSKCSTPESLLAKPHELSSVKKVIAVISGKGGVGKSMTTSLLSVLFARKGYKTAVLDADITGPSIPKAFGIKEKAMGTQAGIFPVRSKTGINVMSINLLLENETDPVIWRGPVIAGTVKQFWTDVIWSDVDYMFVDMPPGTGDVPLTVFQSLPIDGIIVVTSPQQLVSMVVEKSVKMAEMMNIPILGIIENYSYLNCPDCNKKINVFGNSNIDEIAKEHNIEVLGKMPIDPILPELSDKGTIELFSEDYMDECVDKIIEKTK